MLEQKVKAAWRAFIAAKDPSADVSERAWEDLHFTERNAWFSAFRAFVVPTDDPQPVQQCALCGEGEAFTGSCGGGRDNPRALCYTAPQPQPVQEPFGFMNAGQVHEMQQGRLPYGYVYPKDGSGASVAVYTSPQAQPLIEVLTELESMYDKADQITPLHKGMRMAISTACDRVNAVMKKHGITKGTT